MDYKQMEVTLTKSNKGGEKIFVDNFGYHFRSRNAHDEYRWVCTHRKSMLCKSSVITKKFGENHKICRPPLEHNHPKLEYEKIVCRVNNYMKAIAKEESTLTPSQIIEKVSCEVEPLARELLPSDKAQLLKIQRARAKKRKISNDSPSNGTPVDQGKESEDNGSAHYDSAALMELCCRKESSLKSESEMSLNSNYLEEQKPCLRDSEFLPIVRREQDSDGTVNIRIFMEESLLSSFVINAHHTSNVCIRISKADAQNS